MVFQLHYNHCIQKCFSLFLQIDNRTKTKTAKVCVLVCIQNESETHHVAIDDRTQSIDVHVLQQFLRILDGTQLSTDKTIERIIALLA